MSLDVLTYTRLFLKYYFYYEFMNYTSRACYKAIGVLCIHNYCIYTDVSLFRTNDKHVFREHLLLLLLRCYQSVLIRVRLNVFETIL